MPSAPAGFNSRNDNSEFNSNVSLVEQILSRVHTVKLVRVEGVTIDPNGGGTVNVLPLVQMVDSEGNGMSHGVVYSLPYFRYQSGSSAVILDPAIGDIGLAAFADRDSSTAKSTKDVALPGSFRTHSMSDGFYIGGVLNGEPTQYIRMDASGIAMKSSIKVMVDCPDIELMGASLTHNSKNVGSTHTHPTPAGQSGPPQ